MSSVHHIVSGIAAALLVAAAAQQAIAQTSPPGMPELIASNECETGRPCVRQMLQFKQFGVAEQSQLLYLIGLLPSSTSAARGGSSSCSYHGHGSATTLICTNFSSEGSCACVFTTTGHHCIGSNPYCPSLN
jgi:hypothetical protein